jgi:hypothetical protein
MIAVADRPMTKRNDVPVKMDAEVVRIAKIAAAYREQSLAEYLSERMRDIAAHDVEQEHAKQPHRKPASKPRAKKAGGGEE